MAEGMYGQGGGGMGGRGMGGGGGRRHLDDIVEGKIFLGGVDASATTEDIESYCLGWGQINDTFVSPKGYGFVTFASVQDAFNFIEHDQHKIGGRDIEVKAAVSRSRGGGQRSTNKLFVGGVPREVTSEDFRRHFEQYGNIEDAVIVADQSGISRGFGFVTFDNTKSIEKALVVKHLFGERVVDCKRAVPKEEIRNQGGGGAPYGGAGGYAGGGGGYAGGGSGYGGGGGGGYGGGGGAGYGGSGGGANGYGRDNGYGAMASGYGAGMQTGYGAMGGMGAMGAYANPMAAYGMGMYGMGGMGGYGMGSYGQMGGYGVGGAGAAAMGSYNTGAGGGAGAGGGYGAGRNGGAGGRGGAGAGAGARYHPYG